jgi:hypothetical protein
MLLSVIMRYANVERVELKSAYLEFFDQQNFRPDGGKIANYYYDYKDDGRGK